MSRIAVIIPAGGAGRRMGGVAKPLLLLAGEPVLAHSIRPFLARADVEWVVVALPRPLHEAPPAWLTADARVSTVAGGAERGDSVRNALEAVPAGADIILVHDAARPLVTDAIIERCVHAAAAGQCAVAAVPVVDTIKTVDGDGVILDTPDRSRLRAAQTPQAFPAAVLRDACRRAADDGVTATDDAALVAHYGARVLAVEGATGNIKITAAADLALAETLLLGAPGSAPGVQ
jgi:2-C-methyl-D-erythritol 4-phosphate cytidylyltransferase